jgi:hypothetical protein
MMSFFNTQNNPCHTKFLPKSKMTPTYTPGPAEHRTTFDSLKLHRIFGCRRFKNQQHLTAASFNAKLISTGELPPTLGDFATINNKLDESHLPVTTFPKSIRFDGGLTCGLLRDCSDPTPEPFPPGTRVTITPVETILKGTS